MDDTRRIEASRLIEAPIERVFAMLADPDRHPDFDGSGALRASRTHTILTQVGDEFTHALSADEFGDDHRRSIVTTYERDRLLGWSPGPGNAAPVGDTFTFTLEAVSDDRTQVIETYDWSAVTDEQALALMPRVSREALSNTLDNLADVLL